MDTPGNILSAQLSIEPCPKLPGIWEVSIAYQRKGEIFQGGFYVPDSFIDEMTVLADRSSVI